MTCDFDRIDALCAGELSDDERASVLAHMDTCPACRAYYEAMAGLEGEETAPEGFSARVMDAVRATAQTKPRRRRSVWQSVAAMAACAALVVTLGLNSGLFGANVAAPESADDSAPSRSSDSEGADFSGYELPNSFNDNGADDLPLNVHTLTEAQLCAQVRAWLAQQNIPQLYPDGSREAYDLTADQVAALTDEFPLLALPQESLQLELKSAE